MTQRPCCACAGNCGLQVDLPAPAGDKGGAFAALFAEELGLVLEVAAADAAAVAKEFSDAGACASIIGKVSRVLSQSVSQSVRQSVNQAISQSVVSSSGDQWIRNRHRMRHEEHVRQSGTIVRPSTAGSCCCSMVPSACSPIPHCVAYVSRSSCANWAPARLGGTSSLRP